MSRADVLSQKVAVPATWIFQNPASFQPVPLPFPNVPLLKGLFHEETRGMYQNGNQCPASLIENILLREKESVR